MCPYCKAQNGPEEHRCHRCGRRLTGGGPEPLLATRSSTAPALQPQTPPEVAPPRPSLVVVPPAGARPVDAPRTPGVQAHLFGPQALQRPVPRPTAPPPPPARPPKSRRDRVEHPRLDFMAEGAHTLKTSVQAAIYCKAPVAPAPFRSIAAMVDTMIGLLGTGLFLLTVHAAGLPVEFNASTLPAWLGAAVVISVLYRVLFILADADTLGLVCTRLRLVDFDGHIPGRRQRFYRLASGVISCIAGGMGLLWALVDEEHLTWHDQMSSTFPTIADVARSR